MPVPIWSLLTCPGHHQELDLKFGSLLAYLISRCRLSGPETTDHPKSSQGGGDGDNKDTGNGTGAEQEAVGDASVAS